MKALGQGFNSKVQGFPRLFPLALLVDDLVLAGLDPQPAPCL